MKIPLDQEPFPPVTLSRAQEDKIQWLADTLLDETLAQYDEYVHHQNRVLDKNRYKQVIARENIAIYKRVGKGELGGSTPDIDLHNPQAEPRSRYWRLPLCVGVGTLTGTLDDLLYGELATTKDECTIRSSYTKDDGADSRVLATIIKPTESDPLQLLVVRWILLCQLVHRVGVSPRDVLQMESIGARVLPSGERIGYIMVQSIDVPGCGELTHLGAVRASYSACFVFRAVSHGTIEVYMRSYVDPGGKLSDSIAVFSASMALISIWRLMLAGQNKKLAYIARGNTLTNKATLVDNATVSNSKTCPLCQKSLSSFRSRARCDLCQKKLCSRCVDKRKLSYMQPSGKLVRVPTHVCKTCILTTNKMNAGDVSAREQEPNADRAIRLYSTSSAGSQPAHPTPKHASGRLDPLSTFRRQSTDTFTSESTDTFTSESTVAWCRSTTASAVSLLDDDMSLPSPSYMGCITTCTTDKEADVTVDAAQLDLWVRMNQLRMTAEETYNLTRQNGAAMADANGGGGSSQGYRD